MPSAKWNSHNGRLRSSGGAGDFPDHLVELSATAGGGHLNSPQMVVEVDVGVLQPHRVMQSPWNVDELVAQRIQQMQPAEQRAAKHVEGEVAVAICIIDDRDLQGVRVQVGRLAVQQHRIHAVQPLRPPHSFEDLRPLSSAHRTCRCCHMRYRVRGSCGVCLEVLLWPMWLLHRPRSPPPPSRGSFQFDVERRKVLVKDRFQVADGDARPVERIGLNSKAVLRVSFQPLKHRVFG